MEHWPRWACAPVFLVIRMWTVRGLLALTDVYIWDVVSVYMMQCRCNTLCTCVCVRYYHEPRRQSVLRRRAPNFGCGHDSPDKCSGGPSRNVAWSVTKSSSNRTWQCHRIPTTVAFIRSTTLSSLAANGCGLPFPSIFLLNPHNRSMNLAELGRVK